jgi:hypothetical protein
MAKKPKAQPPSPCAGGGPELVPLEIRLLKKDVATFTIHVCRANADVEATLQPVPHGPSTVLFSTHGQAASTATLPALTPGRHVLFWSVLTASATWETRADLVVNGTTRFLRRKNSAGAKPLNMGFLIIEVV